MIVGTAGHIDHGKTALVRALTGVDTDRLKEEKARGISIDLGYAYLPGPDGQVLGFVDVPGHEKFVRNMLAGATGIDYALVVVAADDGVMPQTREHAAILDLLGVARGAVALTKIDLVGSERVDAVRAEIERLLAPTPLAGAEIFPVSTISGQGIGALREALFAAASAPGKPAAAGRFRLAIDRSFMLPGIGTVVTGTILSGAVEVGDRIVVSPSGLTARVRSLHAQNRAAARAVAGERCALNLAGEGIGKDAVVRGDMALDPALHAPASRIDASLRLLPGAPKPMAQWAPVRLHHGAAEVGAHVVPLDDAPLMPGGVGRVQLVLDRPLATAVPDAFILRDTSGRITLGGGRFIDLRAPQRRRRTVERRAQLDALAQRDHAQALTALLAQAPYFTDLAAFARDRALTADERDGLVAKAGLVVLEPGSIAFASASWDALKGEIDAALKRFHGENPQARGLALDKLRLALPRQLPAAVLDAAVQALAKAGELALEGGAVRARDHAMRLAPADAKAWEQVAPLLSGQARFRPPRIDEIAAHLRAPEAASRRLLKSLARMGEVVEIAPDHFFLRASVAEMVDIAAEIAAASPQGEFGAAQFRDRLEGLGQSVGRKVAIQVLEYFDRAGVTLRRGDLRRINPQRRDHFRRAAPMPVSSGREAPPVGRPVFKTGRGR